MAVHELYPGPAESVSDSGHPLPGEFQRAGPEIKGIRQRPVAAAQRDPAADPGDSIPEVHTLGDTSGRGKALPAPIEEKPVIQNRLK